VKKKLVGEGIHLFVCGHKTSGRRGQDRGVREVSFKGLRSERGSLGGKELVNKEKKGSFSEKVVPEPNQKVRPWDR